MIAFVRYTSGLGNAALYARLRNATGQFWDFVALTWGVIGTDCKQFLTEYADSDPTTSYYSKAIVVPSDAIYCIEIVVDATNLVLGYESTEDAGVSTITGKVDTIDGIVDTLATVCTETRLAELDAANLPANIDAILLDTGTTLDGRIPAALTANGNMKCSLMEILTTALTETVGLLAGGFKKFFNVAAPTGTVNSLPDAAPSAAGGLIAATADAVWDESIVNHQAVGSAGESLGAPLGGAVVADPLNSIISFNSGLSSTTDSYCVGSFVKFTSGALINQTGRISGYGGTSKLILVTSGFTAIPTVGDKFIIINQ